MRPLRRRAVNLCRRVAPELREKPVYAMFTSDLPESWHKRGDAMGCTYADLDLTLRAEIDRVFGWQGRGVTFVLNLDAIADPYRVGRVESPERGVFGFKADLDAVTLHELVHSLLLAQHEAREPDPQDQALTVAVRERLADVPAERHDPRPCPYHDHRFLRLLILLASRAPIFLHLAFDATAYGLDDIGQYARALGDEPTRLRDANVAQILATPAPAEFMNLWHADAARLRKEQAAELAAGCA